jgi:hypothetical protein|eukprot:COSAG06_NODE_1692_length_8705_cov_3.636765_6_plen_74_part_00
MTRFPQADESPCNVGNPPEAGYSNDAPHPDGARLLNEEERQRALVSEKTPSLPFSFTFCTKNDHFTKAGSGQT